MADSKDTKKKDDGMEMIDELLAMNEQDGVDPEDYSKKKTDDAAIKDLTDTIMRDIDELTDPDNKDTVVMSFEELQLALEQARKKVEEKEKNAKK